MSRISKYVLKDMEKAVELLVDVAYDCVFDCDDNELFKTNIKQMIAWRDRIHADVVKEIDVVKLQERVKQLEDDKANAEWNEKMEA